jgi:uncharacterized HAD superfamily protein
MFKPRVGTDLDGVCCDWVQVAANIISMEHDLTMNEIYDYLRHGVPDWLEVHFKDVASRKGPYSICPYYSDARVYLNMLDKLGYSISYITHRAEEMRYVTESWLDKAGFPRYLDVYYTDGKSKADYAKELELDFFVEDRLSVAEELVDVVPEVMLITRPWNELKTTEKPILRYSNWFEIYDEITETY